MAEFEVTEDHIRRGVKGCDTCPVALSILPRLVGGTHIRVSQSKIDIWNHAVADDNGAYMCRIYHPDEVRQFITDFDAGRMVSPFKLQADIPPRFLKDAN